MIKQSLPHKFYSVTCFTLLTSSKQPIYQARKEEIVPPNFTAKIEIRGFKAPYHLTFFNVLSLRTPLNVVNDLPGLIWVKIDHFKKIKIFIFSVCLCVKLHSRALGVQLEEPITFSRMNISEPLALRIFRFAPRLTSESLGLIACS